MVQIHVERCVRRPRSSRLFGSQSLADRFPRIASPGPGWPDARAESRPEVARLKDQLANGHSETRDHYRVAISKSAGMGV